MNKKVTIALPIRNEIKNEIKVNQIQPKNQQFENKKNDERRIAFFGDHSTFLETRVKNVIEIPLKSNL